MTSCLIVQHLEPEGPYAIATALEARGVGLDLRDLEAGALLPEDLAGFHALVVMGGPMSARTDESFPSRVHELRLLAEALELSMPVLGVCLGAQLLAAAAGGEAVIGNEGPEIGWHAIEVTNGAGDDPLFSCVSSGLPVLHWHGDTFELPPGAVLLASFARYANQGFRTGPCAWGLQFHLEVDGAAVAAFVDAFGEEAVATRIDPSAIVSASAPCLRELVPVREVLLTRFAELVAARGGAAQARQGLSCSSEGL